jgi:hypothetical protein
MKYVCDAPGGRTWFRIETQAEASRHSALMRHVMERHFCAEMEKARLSFHPPSRVFFEQEIGLDAQLQREMPLFLTLRDEAGTPLVTAMLPPGGNFANPFKPVILGQGNSDPYVKFADSILAPGRH